MMFEGSPEVMLGSIRKVMQLPPNILLYPGEEGVRVLEHNVTMPPSLSLCTGHEYALRDVKFASQLLPTNIAVQVSSWYVNSAVH